jgi:hypothetical protein
MAAPTERTIHVIGYGSVGQAMHKTLGVVIARGELKGIKAIKYRAPEIKEASVDGLFSFAPGPIVTRETLVPLLDDVRSRAHARARKRVCARDRAGERARKRARGCSSAKRLASAERARSQSLSSCAAAKCRRCNAALSTPHADAACRRRAPPQQRHHPAAHPPPPARPLPAYPRRRR